MLSSFLNANRTVLLDQCKTKAAARNTEKLNSQTLDEGVATFLKQLVLTLQAGRIISHAQELFPEGISAPPGGIKPFMSLMGETAARHGHTLMLEGFPIAQVIHSYGDLCQSITELAGDLEFAITTDDFQVLNNCLDNAIADAVTEYVYHRDAAAFDKNADALNVRLGALSHELRNLIHTASLSLEAMKTGKVGIAGTTGAVLERSLRDLRTLVDRSLADVRVTAGLPALNELISLCALIAEAKSSACLEARASKCEMLVEPVDPELGVNVDRQLMLGAIANLLQNAFKYSKGEEKKASLKAYASGDRIFIEVADSCGGLADGAAEVMFRPFNKLSPHKGGLGLGLSIVQRSVIANNGTLSVRNSPGTGCLFTISLPRHAWVPVTAGPPAQ